MALNLDELLVMSDDEISLPRKEAPLIITSSAVKLNLEQLGAVSDSSDDSSYGEHAKEVAKNMGKLIEEEVMMAEEKTRRINQSKLNKQKELESKQRSSAGGGWRGKSFHVRNQNNSARSRENGPVQTRESNFKTNSNCGTSSEKRHSVGQNAGSSKAPSANKKAFKTNAKSKNTGEVIDKIPLKSNPVSRNVSKDVNFENQTKKSHSSSKLNNVTIQDFGIESTDSSDYESDDSSLHLSENELLKGRADELINSKMKLFTVKNLNWSAMDRINVDDDNMDVASSDEECQDDERKQSNFVKPQFQSSEKKSAANRRNKSNYLNKRRSNFKSNKMNSNQSNSCDLKEVDPSVLLVVNQPSSSEVCDAKKFNKHKSTKKDGKYQKIPGSKITSSQNDNAQNSPISRKFNDNFKQNDDKNSVHQSKITSSSNYPADFDDKSRRKQTKFVKNKQSKFVKKYGNNDQVSGSQGNSAMFNNHLLDHQKQLPFNSSEIDNIEKFNHLVEMDDVIILNEVSLVGDRSKFKEDDSLFNLSTLKKEIQNVGHCTLTNAEIGKLTDQKLNVGSAEIIPDVGSSLFNCSKMERIELPFKGNKSESDSDIDFDSILKERLKKIEKTDLKDTGILLESVKDESTLANAAEVKTKPMDGDSSSDFEAEFEAFLLESKTNCSNNLKR